ncbi:MAG TPA: Hsp20/alpha crystallin family protein [Caulobacteraceae bacterium]|nr:Hsp20/alpha crystallin family protein [Caulobacteraceae bacterium]
MANDPHEWMWSEALQMLARAEHMFRPHPARRLVSWQPPVDVFETEREVLVLAALPGVDVEKVEAVIHDGALLIAGDRRPPLQLRNAVIHRMELPQGRFERRVPLPVGRYDGVRRAAVDGCLIVSLSKVQSS